MEPAERARSSPRAPELGCEWPGRVLLALAPLLAVVVYVNALDNPFVFDDRRTILDNPSLADLSNFLFVLVYERFRPVVNLTYAIDRQIWQLNPVGFHLTNLVLHLLNVLLLSRVLRGMVAQLATREQHGGAPHVASDLLPAAATALFACHPLLTEAVGYVSGRAEVLCGTFFLAALCCYQQFLRRRGRRWPWLAACLLLWVAAVGSKEVGALLPAVLLLYDLLIAADEGRARRALVLHGPLLLLVGAGAVVRGVAYLRQESASHEATIAGNALTQIEVVWRYIRLLLLPSGQSVVHAVREVRSALEPRVLLGGLGLGALVALVWRARRRSPALTLGVLWFLLLLTPAAALPLSEVMAEHRVYLASCGFFLAVVAAGEPAADWAARRWRRGPIVVTLLGVALLLSLAVATVRRNAVWHDPLTLWRDAAERAPGVVAPLQALADEHRLRGDCVSAIPFYRRAIDLLPRHAATRNSLGVCLAQLGRYPEAERVLEEITRDTPSFVDAHSNLGLMALARGRVEEARRHFRRALAVDPTSSLARGQLEALAGKR